jgi:hypothetical protein
MFHVDLAKIWSLQFGTERAMFVKQILVDLIAELTTLESHILLFKAKIWGCTYKVLTCDGEALKMK